MGYFFFVRTLQKGNLFWSRKIPDTHENFKRATYIHSELVKYPCRKLSTLFTWKMEKFLIFSSANIFSKAIGDSQFTNYWKICRLMKLKNISAASELSISLVKRAVLVVQNVISFQLCKWKLDNGLVEFSFADFDGIINALHFTC